MDRKAMRAFRASSRDHLNFRLRGGRSRRGAHFIELAGPSHAIRGERLDYPRQNPQVAGNRFPGQDRCGRRRLVRLNHRTNPRLAEADDPQPNTFSFSYAQVFFGSHMEVVL